MRKPSVKRRRERGSLVAYLSDIADFGLLTPEEEIKVAKKARGGSREALEKLTKANLRFVVAVAKEYQGQGLPLAELIGEGNLGLIKAAQRFDETRGFKFISYAVWWIRQSIMEALAKNVRVVHVPQNRIGEANRILKKGMLLEKEFGREPTMGELAEITGKELKRVGQMLIDVRTAVSLFDPAEVDSHDDSASLLDVLSNDDEPPDQYEGGEALKAEIERVLSTLEPREAKIVKLHFGLGGAERPLTLEEIAARFNLTRERIRQIEKKALNRLRFRSRNERLRKYLG